MLKYLIDVSSDVAVAAILCGLLYAFIERRFPEKGHKWLNAGLLVGALAAVVMSYMKNKTSLVHTGIWNLRIFITSTVALLLFLLFLAITGKKDAKKAGAIILPLSAALLAGLLLFYVLPDVYAYPFVFGRYNAETVFSTNFLYRFIGYLAGVILGVLTFFAARFTAIRSKQKTAETVTVIALLVNGVEQVCKSLATMLTRRMIPSNHTLFTIVRYTTNYSRWFIFISLFLVLVLALLLVKESLQAKEPYDNPAEHRRIKAKWRNRRRWATLLIVCCVLLTTNMTVLYAIENKAVELSPPEEYTIEDDTIYVSLTDVSDEHLHRYAYVTPSGTETRFIVIKKPGSGAYGIGLDACEVCGETGYYERDGQVVCIRCDVVMNINTIGFRGGCNPIPIDYSIGDGYIKIPLQELLDNEHEFK